MYSPRISERLVPLIYRAARARKVPMTRWVNEALAKALGVQVPHGNEDAVRHPETKPERQEEDP